MAIFVSLVSFTDAGIKAIKDSPKRSQAFRELAQRKGLKVRDIFWCTGRCDMVVITEGDDEVAVAALLSVASLGNTRSETLRCMDQETFSQVLQNVG
jgi:uncharacterized protein with GYD domain